jgi:hypothetical protein
MAERLGFGILELRQQRFRDQQIRWMSDLDIILLPLY